MEKLNLTYLTKNVPKPIERNYKLQLIEKTELFISNNKNSNNMEDNSKNDGDGTEKEISLRYGIKSKKCLLQVENLVVFEEDMIDLVHQIRFRQVKSNFQRKLNEGLRTIKSSNKTLTPADKTSNMYKLTKDEYNHLLDNAIIAT